MIEDRKAIQDAIERALSMTPPDTEEIERLTEHLNCLEEELKENKN